MWLQSRRHYANGRKGPRLCENARNFDANGTARHFGRVRIQASGLIPILIKHSLKCVPSLPPTFTELSFYTASANCGPSILLRNLYGLRYIPELTTEHFEDQISLVGKGKPDQSQRRKATGPRFLRVATATPPKDPKIAGLPLHVGSEGAHHEDNLEHS